jgi:hypothetical protein
MQVWTEQNFDDTSWHDCHVHGWSITAAEHGQATLTLDIDFILDWQQPGDGAFAFLVAPATLTFFDVFGLVLRVDYTGFAVAPFSISGIEREKRVNAGGYIDFLYRIEVNYPAGTIEFAGNRFRQILRAAPILSQSQSLEPHQRAPMREG